MGGSNLDADHPQQGVNVPRLTTDWIENPWDLVAASALERNDIKSKSVKVFPGDLMQKATRLECSSATDIGYIQNDSLDLCITDPPFGDLMQYAEWSDFFYVWLRPLLKDRYPENIWRRTSAASVGSGFKQGKESGRR